MIKLAPWSADAERELARALPPAILTLVRDEVAGGASMLWDCDDGVHRAFCITRVHPRPREFVIVAFAGSGLMSFGPHFIEAARSRGIPLRAHTVSPVIARLCRRLGFRQAEYVLRAA